MKPKYSLVRFVLLCCLMYSIHAHAQQDTMFARADSAYAAADSTALKLYQNVLQQAQQKKDNYLISESYRRIGNVFQRQSEYPLALDNYLKSLKIKEQLRDTIGISSCLINIGTVHYWMGDLEQSIEYTRKSLDIETRLGNKKGMEQAYMNLGACYADMWDDDDFDSAVIYFNRCIEICKDIGELADMAGALTNLGVVYDNRNDIEQSEAKHIEALAIYQQLNDQRGITHTYINLGWLYANKRGDYLTAIRYFEDAKEIALKTNALNLLSLCTEALSTCYLKVGDYQKAYDNQKLLTTTDRKLRDESRIKEITRLEMQYDFDKQRELTELKHHAAIARQRMLTWFFIIGFLLMVGLAFTIYISFKRKKRDNKLLTAQKTEIEAKSNEIQASILYAKNIQTAILPPESQFNSSLDEYFIFYRPKDIVSGDFYWITKRENKVIVAVGDCTGHGVPGAFMSMLGISFLNEIVNLQGVDTAGEILTALRHAVIDSLRQESGQSKDGMDISLIVIDHQAKEVSFAGAYNPLYIIRDDEVLVLKADSMPVGISDKKQPFTNQLMHIEPNDMLYVFSDGYIDQFGGNNDKKLMATRFKKILLEISHSSMDEQKTQLADRMDLWQGSNEQTDDILVMGIRMR